MGFHFSSCWLRPSEAQFSVERCDVPGTPYVGEYIEMSLPRLARTSGEGRSVDTNGKKGDVCHHVRVRGTGGTNAVAF